MSVLLFSETEIKGLKTVLGECGISNYFRCGREGDLKTNEGIQWILENKPLFVLVYGGTAQSIYTAPIIMQIRDLVPVVLIVRNNLKRGTETTYGDSVQEPVRPAAAVGIRQLREALPRVYHALRDYATH